MKKTVIILSTLAFIASSCRVQKYPTACDQGVEINGVRWATRNVDKPGTFTKNPEDVGMFYQWNSKTGWSTTDSLVSADGSTWDENWNGNNAEFWEITNNVCPEGWRIPTMKEFDKLTDAKIKWLRINGTYGCMLGSGKNKIFLPVAGVFSSGIYKAIDGYGGYWSSEVHNEEHVRALNFFGKDIYFGNVYRAGGFNIRCVAEYNNIEK